MLRDLRNNFDVVNSLPPAVRVNGTASGTSANLQGFNAALIVITPGVVTDGVHTPKLQESDDNSVFTDVAAADQLGALVALASNIAQDVGYVGNKQYVRPVITTTGATTGAVCAAHVLRGNPANAPLA